MLRKSPVKKQLLGVILLLAALTTGCNTTITSFSIDGLATQTDPPEYFPPEPIRQPVYIVYSIAWTYDWFYSAPSISMTTESPTGEKETGPAYAAGTVFTFDPRGRPIGLWKITLTAYGDNGSERSDTISFTTAGETVVDQNRPKRTPGRPQNPFQSGAASGDDVALHSGEFIFHETDLSIETRGIPFSLERTFRSQLDYSGPLGNGWDFPYGQRLYVAEDQSALLLDGRGMLIEFGYNPQTTTYSAPSGVYAVLVKNSDSTYTLNEPRGMKRHFAANGMLTALEDRRGNSITLEYDNEDHLVRVRDCLGRPIDFTYGEGDRIASMTDFTGREVSYQYDGQGNLIAATFPASEAFPGGRTTTYGYSQINEASPELGNNLVSITDPKGQKYLENTYDSADRVTQQIFADGTFTWEYFPAESRTVFTQRDGTRCEYAFDAQGHATRKTIFTRGLRASDPTEFTTRYTYTTHGQITRIEFPRGNEALFLYDEANEDRLAQGNLLEARHKPAAPSTLPELATSFVYEPRFQQVRSIVDARGNHPSFGPAARYKTAFVYDYEEGPDGLNQDVNGDGRTDQVRGNLVKVQHPSTTVVNPDGSPTGSNSSHELLVYDDRSQLVRHIRTNGSVDQFEYFAPPANPGDPDSREGYVNRITRDAGGIAATTSFARDPLGRATSVSDANGNVRTLEYSESDQVLRTVDPAPFNYEKTYDYDANDDLIRTSLQNARSDGSGQTVIDPTLPSIVDIVTYNKARKITSVSRTLAANLSQVIRVEYDPEDRINRVISAEGRATAFAHDERGLLLEQRRGVGTPDATSVVYRYNLNGSLEQVIDARGNRWAFEQDAYDRPIRVIDPEGAKTELELDPVGNKIASRSFDFLSSGGRLLSEVLADYDEANRLVRVRSPVFMPGSSPTGESIMTVRRDNSGRITRITNPRGNSSQFQWDNLDRMSLATDAVGNQTRNLYDQVGNLLQSTIIEHQEGGDETFTDSYEYDSLNRVVLTRDNIGRTRRVAHDSRSNIVFASDANGGIHGNGNGPGNTSRFVFDGAGRLLRSIQEMREGGTGQGPVFDSIETSYAWDLDDNLLSVTDDNGNSTVHAFDALDRLVRTTYPDQTFELVHYDPNGNPSQFTQRNGTVVSSGYGPTNRLLSRAISRAAGIEGIASENYAHDGLGRITLMTNDVSNVSRAFDSLGRLVRETQNGAVLDLTHDLASNRISTTLPGGRRLDYAYDNLERLTTVTDSYDADPLASLRYLGSSRLQEVHYQNGTATSVAFDAVPRPETILHKQVKSLLPSTGGVSDGGEAKDKLFRGFQYIFDREDNQLAEIGLKHSDDPSGFRLARGDLYSYDSAYRLTRATQGVKDPMMGLLGQDLQNFKRQTAYDLDGLANWTKVTSRFGADQDSEAGDDDHDNPSLRGNEFTTEYANNFLNQTTGITYRRTPKDIFQELRYDPNGNRTSDGEFRYTYDYRNRIVRADQNTTNSTWKVLKFAYDNLGRRISREVQIVEKKREKKSSSSSSSSKGGEKADPDQWVEVESVKSSDVTKLYYDGTTLVEEQNAAGNTLRTYVHSMGTGSVLSMDVDRKENQGQGKKERYFYHANILGTITDLTDSKGNVAESYRYTPYGTPTPRYEDFRSPETPGHSRQGFFSVVGNPFLYGGQRFEESLGLYNLWLRDYDSDTGKFLQVDPVGLLMGGANLYAYCIANPINYIDPLGLMRQAKFKQVRQQYQQAAESGSFKDKVVAFRDAVDYIVNDDPLVVVQGFQQAWSDPNVGDVEGAKEAITHFVGTTAAGMAGYAVGFGLSGNPLVGDIVAGFAAQAASDAMSGQSSTMSQYAMSGGLAGIFGFLMRTLISAFAGITWGGGGRGGGGGGGGGGRSYRGGGPSPQGGHQMAAEKFTQSIERAKITPHPDAPKNFPELLQCESCADEVFTALKEAGHKPQRVSVEAASDYIISRDLDDYARQALGSSGPAISNNGRHFAVKVGDFIYDNVHPGGLHMDAWAADLTARGGGVIKVNGRVNRGLTGIFNGSN